ncbi:MAG: hypothetical protein GC155_12085 [Alphaproteobacteria bacterium]|nr:hypothetical protein [Alphaproteobacteria bacterium]
MTEQRPPKKSESVEVRLPFEAKQAFLSVCKAQERTASEVIRSAIDAFVENGGHEAAPQDAEDDRLSSLLPKPLRRKRYLAAGAVGAIGLAALVALPSAAAPNLAQDHAAARAAAFARLDRNGDGVVSYQEYVLRQDR